MKFFDLPEELNVGGAHLTLASRFAILKEYTCDHCERVSISVFVCSSTHVLCKGCCVVKPNNQVWCPVCTQVVAADEDRLSTRILSELRFKCACGFTDTLVAMKEHLRQEPTSSHGQAVCGSEAGRTQTSESIIDTREDFIRNIAIEEIEKRKRPILDEFTQKLNISQNFEELQQKMQQQRDEFIRRIETQNIDISSLKEKSDSTMKILKQVQQTVSAQSEKFEQYKEQIGDVNSFNATTSTGHLWFNFDHVHRRFVENSPAYSPCQSAIVDGIPLDVVIGLKRMSYRDVFGIYFRPVGELEKYGSAALKRAFTVKVHDIKGLDIAMWKISLSQTGIFYCGCKFSSYDISFSGCENLLSVKSIQENNCLSGGMIRVSVEISSLE